WGERRARGEKHEGSAKGVRERGERKGRAKGESERGEGDGGLVVREDPRVPRVVRRVASNDTLYPRLSIGGGIDWEGWQKSFATGRWSRVSRVYKRTTSTYIATPL